MAYVVVEPHSDDAFLSLGWHIERWCRAGIQVHIMTIYAVNKRSLIDAHAYAKAVGADWEGFELGSMRVGNKHDVLKRVRISKTDQLILPLGGAPLNQTAHTGDHWRLRNWLQRPGCLYYLDQPYAVVQKHSERFTNMLYGLEVVSYCKAPKRKWRHIPLFTGQQKFFYYNNITKLQQTCELLVRKVKHG